MDFQAILDTVVNWATSTGIKIVIALLIWFISFRIINFVARRLEKRMLGGKHPLDKTLTRTFVYLFKLVLKVVVIVCLIGYLGIDTSGITALIASFGVCVGLAVNGALSNFAGGVLLLITRPFRVDDFIEAAGHSGTVEDIHLVNTRIRTPDNKIVYIPNGTLSSSSIINYSEKEMRRVDLTFSIGYGDNFEEAKQIITDICTAHEKVLKDPAPFIRVVEHGASSINIVTRAWVFNSDYWDVYFDLLESVKKAFDEKGIEIPFNQIDVHVKND